MKVNQVLALSALALAAGVAFADETPQVPLTRAEVVQAAGQGELGLQFTEGVVVPSRVSRAEVKSEVLAARADHELIRGQIDDQSTYAAPDLPESTLTRAEVKSEVLEARGDHELLHGQMEPRLAASRSSALSRSAISQPTT
jgi:hypothetical protein